MAGILAKQDQENLVYGHQQAAASKPLNQLRPKTPGNKVFFNDENLVKTQGKTVFKRGGNENLVFAGKKELATPAATTKNRAPLGAKTTNAKAKPFNTPTIPNKTVGNARNGSTARRNKVKIAQSEPAKIDVLQTKEDDYPDIEYMPPPVKDLPDVPEELENRINLSMFENGGMQRDFFKHMWHSKGPDGKSAFEREQEHHKLLEKIGDAEDEALETYGMDLESIVCNHEPDCPTEECKDAPARRQQAKDKLDRQLTEIRNANKSPMFTTLVSPVSKAAVSKVNITKGPTTKSSREAASALAMAKSSKPSVARPTNKAQGSKLIPSILSNPNQPLTTRKPTNPSPMRHTAAVAASNTTLGYGKGRAMRANLRQGILAPKDSNSKVPAKGTSTVSQKAVTDLNDLQPADYMRLHGEPKFLSEMWWRCKTAGLIKLPGEEDKKDDAADIQAALFQGLDVEAFEREEAERDFELVLP